MTTTTMSLKALERAISKAAGRTTKNNHEWHVLLCHATMHALENGGDVSAYDKIMAGMLGKDRKAVARWVKEFGVGRIRDDGTFELNKGAFKQHKDNLTLDELVDSAPWFEFVPNAKQIARTLNGEARTMALIAALEAAQADETKTVVHADVAKFLREALTRYHLAVEMGEAN